MGTETTSATYRRTQNPLVTKVSTELLESKETDSEHLLQNNNYPVLAALEVSCWNCVSDGKSFSDNAFSIICGKELHFLLNLRLLHEKLRCKYNSFYLILHKALLPEEIIKIFLRNMQLFFIFKPIYVALRPSNTLVLQDLLSSCLCHAS